MNQQLMIEFFPQRKEDITYQNMRREFEKHTGKNIRLKCTEGIIEGKLLALINFADNRGPALTLDLAGGLGVVLYKDIRRRNK